MDNPSLPDTRIDAQRRADEIRIFQKELGRLEGDGVLTLSEEQRLAVQTAHQNLLEGYAQAFDIDRDVRAKQVSLGMRIVSFLGALALAASVVLLFRQFWGLFPSAAQVAILSSAALGTFLATLWIQGKDSSGYFTKLAAMVAFACFVANIYMLGQIFNITPSDKALIPWAALALLLAYTCDLRLLLAAGLLCFIAFVSARTGTWGGMYWLDFGRRPENFFPAGILLFLVPLVVPHRRFGGFAPIYRVFALITVLLVILVMGNWGFVSYLPLKASTVEYFYQVLGFVLSAAVAWVGVRRQWTDVVNTGVIFFVIFLYTKFFDWWWEIMPKYLFFLVVGLTALLFLVVLRRLRASGARSTGGGAA